MHDLANSQAVRKTYTAIKGRVYGFKSLGKAFKTAQWQTNIVYNAAIDSKRDFEANVLHALAYSAAKAAGEKLPEKPVEQDSFRAFGQEASLTKIVSQLLKGNPVLAGLPLSAYANAIEQAERARKALVKSFKGLQSGDKAPKLHFRSMRDAVSITTDNFRLYERRPLNWKRPYGPPLRSDSPLATRGKTKIKVAIQGLPRFNANLSQPIPYGSEIKQIVVTMQPLHGCIEVSLICEQAVPCTRQMEEDRAWRIHGILQKMPDDLSAQEALKWARAHGILIRGDDLGIQHPSMDDAGNTEKRVAPERKDNERIESLQKKLSHKYEAAILALPEDAQKLVRDGKAKFPAKSKAAKCLQRQIRKARSGIANRSRTAAYVAAKRLVKGVHIIATDPPQMAAALIRKGGPAERKKRRAADAAIIEISAEIKSPSFLDKPAIQRSIRANMAATNGAFRVHKVAQRARDAGVLHIMPGFKGSSSVCPACSAPKNNALSERAFTCDCGLSMERDQASAQITAARALYALKDSNDPGDMRCKRNAAEEKALAKAQKLKSVRLLGLRKKQDARSGASSGSQDPDHKHRGDDYAQVA